MQAAGLAPFLPRFRAAAAPAGPQWPIQEGPDTPKICLPGGRDEASMRRVKQVGVDYVMGGMGRTHGNRKTSGPRSTAIKPPA